MGCLICDSKENVTNGYCLDCHSLPSMFFSSDVSSSLAGDFKIFRKKQLSLIAAPLFVGSILGIASVVYSSVFLTFCVFVVSCCAFYLIVGYYEVKKSYKNLTEHVRKADFHNLKNYYMVDQDTLNERF